MWYTHWLLDSQEAGQHNRMHTNPYFKYIIRRSICHVLTQRKWETYSVACPQNCCLLEAIPGLSALVFFNWGFRYHSIVGTFSLLYTCTCLIVLQMTRQLSLCGLAEFIFHLTRLDPEMLQITRGSGCLSQTFYKFEINKEGKNTTLVL